MMLSQCKNVGVGQHETTMPNFSRKAEVIELLKRTKPEEY